jgi:hypothetical protein
MSLGREGVFVKSKSRRSPRFATKRQLTGVLLTDSASQSNASKGRENDGQDLNLSGQLHGKFHQHLDARFVRLSSAFTLCQLLTFEVQSIQQKS